MRAAAAADPAPPCIVYQPPRRACCHGPVVKAHCCAAPNRALLRSSDIAAGGAKLLGEGASEDRECTYTFALDDGSQARAKITRWDAKTYRLDDLLSNDREAGHHVTQLAPRTFVVDGDGERGAWIAGTREVAHLQLDEVLMDGAKFEALVRVLSTRLASP